MSHSVSVTYRGYANCFGIIVCGAARSLDQNEIEIVQSSK